jgi:hypothetical protein
MSCIEGLYVTRTEGRGHKANAARRGSKQSTRPRKRWHLSDTQIEREEEGLSSAA